MGTRIGVRLCLRGEAGEGVGEGRLAKDSTVLKDLKYEAL